jgi:hypothetical protein
VTFGNVTTAGATNVTLDPQCAAIPQGFIVAGDAGTSCLTVTTTASYNGGVNVCIPVPPPVPTSPAVVQCDPNPTQAPCPIAGIDPRLDAGTFDPTGNPLCCGRVDSTITSAAGSNPICFTTAGLSLFAVGTAVSAMPSTPAVGAPMVVWLAIGLALLGGAAAARQGRVRKA